MPRKARLDTPGTLHHIIVRGIEKRRIVDDDKDRSDFVARMGKISTETKTAIYAWALMTNHAHILLRSGSEGVSRYMRCLLTGYAVTYNLRHKRHGHLFQNRYKSIVCEEDGYFKELVRYIHLNPLRAGLVQNMSELADYKWCGYGVLMGRFKNAWQDCDGVLSWFGNKEMAAKKAYRQYMQEGVTQGSRPDLVGGGLIRSRGGWSRVISMNRQGNRELSDERILGGGTFVESILKETEEKVRYQFARKQDKSEIEKMIKMACEKANVGFKELKSGNRQVHVVRLRSQLAFELIRECGVSLAEAARQLGVTTSAIAKSLSRKFKK